MNKLWCLLIVLSTGAQNSHLLIWHCRFTSDLAMLLHHFRVWMQVGLLSLPCICVHECVCVISCHWSFHACTHTHTFAVVPADELHFVCTSEDHCGSLKKEKSDCIFYWKRMHVLLNMKIWGCQIKQWWVCHACTWFCVLRMAPFWLSLHCSQ